MTHQAIMNTVAMEAANMDKDALIEAYLRTSQEVLSLSDDLEALQGHTEGLESIVSGIPEALERYEVINQQMQAG